MARVAQFQREITAENIRTAMDRRRRDVHWMGPAPYGCRSSGEGGARRPCLVRDEAPARTLPRMREMCETDGLSTAAIAKRFNAEGVPSPRGKKWSETGVNNALTCPPPHAGLVKDADGEWVSGDHWERRIWEPEDLERIKAAIRSRATCPWRALRCVLYARVSSKEQEEGYSLDSQLKLLREYCASKEIAVEREFVEAETAKAAGRRLFNEMVAYVRERGLEAVVVEKTDRIYRNLKDRVTVDELGVELHLVKEGEVISKDSRSHAKFVHDIKLVVSKNYVDNLSEETKKGMLEKARQGIWPTNSPLGYLNVEEGNRRFISLDPERAPLVKALFEEYAAGRTSLRELSRWSYLQGFRSKKGLRVGKSAIARMLQNDAYCGLVTWLGETHVGQHTPLVSRTLYDKVQDLMHGRNRNNAGFGTLPFAYRGLFVCGHCGCGFTAERKKGRYVYTTARATGGAVPSRSCERRS